MQAMYLVFYVVTLIRHDSIFESVQGLFQRGGGLVTVIAIATAILGIAVRLFFLSGIALHDPRVGRIFLTVFVPLMILDELWALSPLLIWREIGGGLALAAVAALVWAPFAQRTLIRMVYPQAQGAQA